MRQLGRGFVRMAIVGLGMSALTMTGCASSANSSAAAAAAATAAKASSNTAAASFAQMHPGARVIAARPYRPTGGWVIAYRNPNGTIGYAAYDAHGRPALLPAAIANSLPAGAK